MSGTIYARHENSKAYRLCSISSGVILCEDVAGNKTMTSSIKKLSGKRSPGTRDVL